MKRAIAILLAALGLFGLSRPLFAGCTECGESREGAPKSPSNPCAGNGRILQPNFVRPSIARSTFVTARFTQSTLMQSVFVNARFAKSDRTVAKFTQPHFTNPVFVDHCVKSSPSHLPEDKVNILRFTNNRSSPFSKH